MSVDLVRLVAYTRLLSRQDPPDLKSADLKVRGHHLTQAGTRDRFDQLWLRSSQTWSQHRLAVLAGAEDGWKPAQRTHGSRVRRFA